ncbi:MAG: primosomal protein N', partial [Clostridiales bacterium]|nr:primosomal protein N' [Clostridiales bacterium]
MTHYANVIVDVANSDVDRIFDYIIPDDIQIESGMRVKVPFGPRTIEGYVIAISNTTDVPQNRLKSIIKCLDDIPSLTKETLELAHWMKEKYRCLLVDSLRVMFPAQMR